MATALSVAWLCGACGPNTDLVVPPPPKVPESQQIDLPEPLESGRLPDWARPRRYALRMNVDPSASSIGGEVFIEVTLDRPTSAVVLHGAEMEVTRAEVIMGKKRLGVDASFRQAAGATTENEELVLVAPREIPASTVVLHVEYTAPLTDKLRGIYKVNDDGKAYVFTQFEPSDARRMFPSFDDPIYKVPFDLEVKVPTGNMAFSNTPEKERIPSADGKSVTFRFETSRPMPTYLVALAVGPLEVRNGPKEPAPLRVISAEGKSRLGQAALTMASEQLAIMTELFGSPYPYDKLDLVAVPNFGPGAMENAGLVTFREELLLLDDKTASAKSKRNVATIIAHELAHQWFGNLVTMKWWDDLWLNEGFATYMEALVVDRWKPEMRAGLEMLSSSGWVMNYDALESARAVRQPVSNTYQASEAFDPITYIKGASVIRMLHRWLGDDVFFRGLRRYLTSYAWQNASASEIFAAWSHASGQDVSAVASTFLDRPGVPLVKAELVCDAGDKPRVRLSQMRYQAKQGGVAAAPLWQIPICVAYEADGRACTLLTKRQDELALDAKRCPGWLLPNAGYDGYYRYHLPSQQLAALGKASLEGGTVDKVGYLTNLWALVQAGELEARELLEHLQDLKKQRDREVVEQLIATLHNVSDALVEPVARPRFERYAAALLLPTAKRLGWDNRAKEPDDDRLLRRSVLEGLAVLTHDGWLRREAKRRAKAFLEDPSSVDSDTAAIALRVAARRGDVSFELLKKALTSTTAPGRRVALVQALGSLGKAEDLRAALDLSRDGTIRAQDVLYMVRAAVEWPDSRQVLIDWLADNLGELAKRFPGFGAARMIGSIRRVCDSEARDAAEQTFTPLVRTIGASERRLREALEASALCIDLRKRQAAKVTRYLEKRR